MWVSQPNANNVFVWKRQDLQPSGRPHRPFAIPTPFLRAPAVVRPNQYDMQLRAELISHGYNPPPITTPAVRKMLEARLNSYINASKQPVVQPIQSALSTLSITPSRDNIALLSDMQLRAELMSHGYDPPPISTPAVRKLLETRLNTYRTAKGMFLPSAGASGTSGSSRYSTASSNQYTSFGSTPSAYSTMTSGTPSMYSGGSSTPSRYSTASSNMYSTPSGGNDAWLRKPSQNLEERKRLMLQGPTRPFVRQSL